MDHCPKCGADVRDCGIFACGRCRSCVTEDQCRGCTGDLDCPARPMASRSLDAMAEDAFYRDPGIPRSRVALEAVFQQELQKHKGRAFTGDTRDQIRSDVAELITALDNVIADAIERFAAERLKGCDPSE